MGRYEKEDRTVFDFWRQVEISDKETGEKARGEGSSMKEAERNAFEALKSGRDSWNAEYLGSSSDNSTDSDISSNSSYSPSYSSGGDYGGDSYYRSSEKSSFSVLQKIFLTILLGTVLGLGIVHYENYRTISRRIQKPDTAVILEPGPPIPDGNVSYSFDITSTSSPERVVRINHHGSLFGKGKEYTISRSEYPEFYRRLDIDRNGEVVMREFTRHGVIFEGLTEGIRDGDLESIVNRFLRRADGLCFTEENTYYSPKYRLECD